MDTAVYCHYALNMLLFFTLKKLITIRGVIQVWSELFFQLDQLFTHHIPLYSS